MLSMRPSLHFEHKIQDLHLHVEPGLETGVRDLASNLRLDLQLDLQLETRDLGFARAESADSAFDRWRREKVSLGVC